MTRIFISYGREDVDFAKRLTKSLEERGFDVWIDYEDIPAGVKWSSAVQEGLDSSDVMLIVVTPDSMASRNVEDEWQYFLDANKPIIPILCSPAKIHFQLKRIQRIEFHKHTYDHAFQKLCDELKQRGIAFPPFYTLEVLQGPSAFINGKDMGQRLTLAQNSVVIGRNGQLCDVQFYDISSNSAVSRVHCSIVFQDLLDGFFIVDEASTYGTFVNKNRCSPHKPFPLRDNDIVELGILDQLGVRLRFNSPFLPGQIDDAAEAEEIVVQSTGVQHPDVFLSFAQEDAAIGEKLQRDFIKGRLVAWTHHIDLARSIVVVFSSATKDAQRVTYDLKYAQDHKIPLFFLLLEDKNDLIPTDFKGVPRIKLADNYDKGLAQAVRRIRKALSPKT